MLVFSQNLKLWNDKTYDGENYSWKNVEDLAEIHVFKMHIFKI